jgi:putative Mn2+ efflux pump MntP
VTGKLIALVVPLGLDTFAVSAALGIVGVSHRQRARISALFTAFEAGMPLVGLALGAPLGRAVGGSADYVASGVLLAVGLYMILASDERDEAKLAELASLSGLGALVLGLSISLDELAIGFTLGLLRLPTALVIAVIAGQALVVTQVGLRLGRRLGERWREAAERLAGLALAGLALALSLERLFS